MSRKGFETLEEYDQQFGAKLCKKEALAQNDLVQKVFLGSAVCLVLFSLCGDSSLYVMWTKEFLWTHKILGHKILFF